MPHNISPKKKERTPVYLDKFISFPHLAQNASKPKTPPLPSLVTNSNNGKLSAQLQINLDHINLPTVLKGKLEPISYPNGTITHKYRTKVNKKMLKLERSIHRKDITKFWGKYQQSKFMEYKLLELNEKRHRLNEICHDQERSAMNQFIESVSSVSSLDNASMSMQSMESSYVTKKSNKMKLKKLKEPRVLKPRKKRIYNQSSLLKCILDTSTISIISDYNSNANRNHQHDNDYDSLSISSSASLESASGMISEMDGMSLQSDNWDNKSLKLAYDM